MQRTGLKTGRAGPCRDGSQILLAASPASPYVRRQPAEKATSKALPRFDLLRS